MKQIIQNLLHVFKRFRTATVLNILGLSIAFASFIIIMMQVNYDYTFDKCHKDYERIYRVSNDYGEKGGNIAVVSRGLTDELVRSTPEIEAACLYNPFTGDLYFMLTENPTELRCEKRAAVSSSFTDVFHLDMLAGNAKALDEPNKILVPESFSKKYFGTEGALDKKIQIDEKNFYTIGGVYKDFPENSSIGNLVFCPMDKNENLNNWWNSNYYVFAKLKTKEPPVNFGGSIKLPEEIIKYGYSQPTLGITPLEKLHTTTNVMYDMFPKTDAKTIYILISIALIVLIIAGVNFTNFSMALVPMRIKSINTRKVLGASQLSLRALNLSEAIAICLISYVLALLWVYATAQTPIANLMEVSILLSSFPLLTLGTAIIAILLGIVAGIYPAYYITSFKPALILKGSFGLSVKGRSLRNALIGIQFIVSFTLIICASFMYLQNHYMRSSSLGFDKDQLIMALITPSIKAKKEVFKNELMAFSGIKYVSFGHTMLGNSDDYMSWGRNYEDKNVSFTCIPVEYSFLDVLGIKMTEGRKFRESDDKLKFGAYIFNEKAQKAYDIKLNTYIDSAEIVGFCEDFNFASFRREIAPMAFMVNNDSHGSNYDNFTYIRVEAGSDMFAAMEHIKSVLKKMEPVFPFEPTFFDSILNNLYKSELRMTSLITLFSLIAILISIAGVFGLVVFECEYKRKEISIRKVNGSSVGEILLLFNKSYIRILLVCFVIAVPVSYYAVDTWLQNFAYRTAMHWWVFLASGLTISLITIATINFQSWKAARTNPVNALKNE